jgi:hypothetical protein
MIKKAATSEYSMPLLLSHPARLEFIFGGTTMSVLTNTSTTVLISH